MDLCKSGDPSYERSFKGHRDAINSVHFNPNMRQLASGGNDNFVMVWHFQEQMRSFRFVGHQKPVTWVRFSPNGNLIASASEDNTVRLWTPTIKGESVVLKCHHSPIRCVEFCTDGSKLLTTSDDKTIKLWDAQDRRFITSFVEHKNWVRCANFSSNDKLIVSGSDDRSVIVWDRDCGKCIHAIKNLSGRVTNVSFNPREGNCIAASFTDGTVRIWDLRTHNLIQLYQPVKEVSINGMAFHPGGSLLLTASDDSNLRILDLLEGRTSYTLHGHMKSAKCVTFSHNGEYFASGSLDEQVFVWKTNIVPHDFKMILHRIELAEATKDDKCELPAVSNCHSSNNCTDSTSNEAVINDNVRSQNCRPMPDHLGDSSPVNDSMPNYNADLEKRVGTMEGSVQNLNATIEVLTQTVSLLEQKLSMMQDKFNMVMPLSRQLQRLEVSPNGQSTSFH